MSQLPATHEHVQCATVPNAPSPFEIIFSSSCPQPASLAHQSLWWLLWPMHVCNTWWLQSPRKGPTWRHTVLDPQGPRLQVPKTTKNPAGHFCRTTANLESEDFLGKSNNITNDIVWFYDLCMFNVVCVMHLCMWTFLYHCWNPLAHFLTRLFSKLQRRSSSDLYLSSWSYLAQFLPRTYWIRRISSPPNLMVSDPSFRTNTSNSKAHGGSLVLVVAGWWKKLDGTCQHLPVYIRASIMTCYGACAICHISS